jgi:hypothetical protein
MPTLLLRAALARHVHGRVNLARQAGLLDFELYFSRLIGPPQRISRKNSKMIAWQRTVYPARAHSGP